MRIGVDIGGTFTDCAIIHDTGAVWAGKALSTAEPVDGVLAAIENAARQGDRTVEEVLGETDLFVHGTTIGTNAVLERTGARTGLLTTRGHEDGLFIGRLLPKRAGLSESESIHVSNLIRPAPIVPRQRIVGVNERIDRDGQVLAPLSEAEVATSVRGLVEEHGIEALAVSFLWSFVEPRHELAVKQIALDLYPQLYVTVSSEIAPVIGEYERTVTAVLNAYIGVAMRSYLGALEERLHGLGFRRTLLVMEAGGGVAPASYAADHPIVTLDSGPVGGVAGARYLGAKFDDANVLCTDVGGTSFDVALVVDGQPEVADTPVIDKFTYQLSKVAVASVGAGGGSIAYLDAAGALHVGPESAGSEPGPVCYGRGGTQPTVTDADLVLGYLSPDRFWGGRLRLDVEAATEAIGRLAEQIGFSTTEMAAAIADIANANMADLIRKHTIEHGRDPRDFALFVYGGAGPVHGAFYGADLGVRRVFFVRNAGVFSALGMTTSDVRFSESKSALFRTPFPAEAMGEMDGVYRQLEDRVRERFAAADLDPSAVVLQRLMRARFGGQVNEVEMHMKCDDLTTLSADDLVGLFVEAYEASYGEGTAYAGSGLEVVTFRVVGTLPTGDIELGDGSLAGDADPSDALKTTRPMYDRRQGRYVEGHVYEDSKIRPGMLIAGPAVIEREGDTVVVPSASRVSVDQLLNLVLYYEE